MKISTTIGVFVAAFILLMPAVLHAQSYTPPAGCMAWYDGCNWCSRMPDGGAVCTKRACMPDTTEQPYCSASANPSTPVQAPAPVEAAATAADIAVDTAVQTAVDVAIAPAVAEVQETVGWLTWAWNIVTSVFSWF